MRADYGNPSSLHRSGERARSAVWTARERVADAFSATPEEILFVGSASEANNLVVKSVLHGPMEGYRTVTSAVEHSSVLESLESARRAGSEVIVLPVDADGLVSEEQLAEAIAPGRTLVSIQWANNETGVVQPIERLAKIARDLDAVFHTDAVQAAGKLSVDFASVPVDFASISAHKVHGPMGIGALYARRKWLLNPLVTGGEQETGLRAGTENIPGIVGVGVALKVRMARFREVADRVGTLGAAFEKSLRDSEPRLIRQFNGSGVDRLPGTSNVCFLDTDGEAMTIRLDQTGVRCSQSSACTNHRPEPSYVLRAMGLSEAEAYSSIRFAFGEMNSRADVEDAVAAIVDVHASLPCFVAA